MARLKLTAGVETRNRETEYGLPIGFAMARLKLQLLRPVLNWLPIGFAMARLKRIVLARLARHVATDRIRDGAIETVWPDTDASIAGGGLTDRIRDGAIETSLTTRTYDVHSDVAYRSDSRWRD